MRRDVYIVGSSPSLIFRVLAIIYMTLAVLGPWINVGMVRGIRPEEMLLPLMAMLCLVEKRFDLRLSKPLGLVLVGLAVIAGSISLSLLATIPRSGEGPVARDTLELVRVAKYAVIMVLGAYDVATARACRKWFVVLVLLATAIAFVQVMAPPERVFQIMSVVDPGSAKFYASQNIAAGLRRVTGSFGNPNNFGVFLAASAGLLVGLLASSTSRVQSWLLGCALAAVCAAVVMTQSFTDLFALGSVLLVGYLAALFRRQYRKRALTLFVVVAIIAGMLAGILGVLDPGSSVIGRRLTDATYALETMGGRFRVWTTVAMSMADDPGLLVFGMGPQKESETHVVGGDIDSDYITILKRYGIVGFLCFGLFILLVIAALRMSSSLETHVIQGWRFGTLLMLLVILVCDLTNVVYVNNQLMDIFMFVLGCVLRGDSRVPAQVLGPRGALVKQAKRPTLPTACVILENSAV